MDQAIFEATVKDAVARYNTKTTHCLVADDTFHVYGFQAILTCTRTREAKRVQVQLTTPFNDSHEFRVETLASEFRDVLEAFHAFTGVTQQLMSADGAAPYEVKLFEKWFERKGN